MQELCGKWELNTKTSMTAQVILLFPFQEAEVEGTGSFSVARVLAVDGKLGRRLQQ